MHISEGVLSPPVLIAGAVLSAAGIAVGLKKLTPERMMPAALFSSAFFVASLVHLPIGSSSVHLVLSGLVGFILGWAAFPALFVALVLQALFLQFGGITVLGANTANIAIPTVLCSLLFKRLIQADNPKLLPAAAFFCGALPVLLSAVLSGLCLMLSGESFRLSAYAIFVAHLPVALVEGIITSGIVTFLKKVKPDMLFLDELSLAAGGAGAAGTGAHNVAPVWQNTSDSSQSGSPEADNKNTREQGGA